MASVNIRPYVDQENASATGVRGRVGGGLKSGPVGKTFQSSSQKSLVTPRRALGDVNNVQRMHSKQGKGAGLKQNNPSAKKAPLFKLVEKSQINSGEKQCQQIEKPEVKVAQSTTCTVNTAIDDIEHMHISPDLPDTYEDILPMSERPSTHIQDIVDWRPNIYSFHHADYDRNSAQKMSEELLDLTEKPLSDSTKYSDSALYVSDSELLDLPPLEFEDCADLFLPMI